MWLCKFYKSNVIGLYISSVPTIIANDYESVREILVRQEFDGRPELLIARVRDPHLNMRGVFFTEGEAWKTNRRFILRHLRDYGFGRRHEEFEIELRDEISSFLELIRNGPEYPHEYRMFKGDGSVRCPDITFAMFGNAFMKTLSGERLPRKDQGSIFKAADLGMIFQKNGDDYGRIFSIVPWMAKYFPNLSGFNQVKKGNEGVYEFIKDVVDRQIETYDPKYERNVIDLYITEMRKAEAANDGETQFICK